MSPLRAAGLFFVLTAGFSIGVTVAQPEPEPAPFQPLTIPELQLPSVPLPPPLFPPSTDQPTVTQPQELPELQQAPIVDVAALRRQLNPPDPIIANLVGEERQQVMALVQLVNDFAAEIRERERRFRAEWFDRTRQEDLLQTAFEEEGALRRYRTVAPDNLPTAETLGSTPDPTVNQFMSFFDARSADHLNRKQNHAIRPRGEGTGGNCVPYAGNEFSLRDDVICYLDDEPTDWILGNYVEKDWFVDSWPVSAHLLQVSETVDGETVASDGAVSTFLELPYREFYDRHARVVEALARSIGTGEQSVSALVVGVRVDDDPFNQVAGAHLDSDGYRLHSVMREALPAMHEYMERARDSWRTYERAISRELPVLYSRAVARSLSHAQRIGILQEPLYAQLLAVYNQTPRVNSELASDHLDAQRQAYSQYVGFVNGNHEALTEIARLRDCIAESRLRPAVHVNLAWPVFQDPQFHIVEMLPDVEPGSAIPLLPTHVKGETAGLDVYSLANGIGHMPAGGGLVLEECGLLRDEGEDVSEVEVSAPDMRRRSAFGASDEARP